MKRLFLAALSTAILGACSSMGGDGQTTMAGETAPMPGDMTPEDARTYVMMAGASDMFEIESSQMALSRATRPEVRQYAQMLIQHHTQTTQQVMAAARAAGMSPPPPKLMPMQVRMLEELRRASDANFDRDYLIQQVPAHEMALALHRNYAQDGDTPALKSVAGTAVPIVQSHLDQARQLGGRT
jgi:putative membrane protein